MSAYLVLLKYQFAFSSLPIDFPGCTQFIFLCIFSTYPTTFAVLFIFFQPLLSSGSPSLPMVHSCYFFSRHCFPSNRLFYSSFPWWIAFPCLPLSSSPFNRYTDQWKHRCSPISLHQCYFLSWQLKARLAFGSKLLGMSLLWKTDSFFETIPLPKFSRPLHFLWNMYKAIFGREKNQENLRTTKDIICWMMSGVPRLAFIQAFTLHNSRWSCS